jgi:hypothetical protein
MCGSPVVTWDTWTSWLTNSHVCPRLAYVCSGVRCWCISCRFDRCWVNGYGILIPVKGGVLLDHGILLNGIDYDELITTHCCHQPRPCVLTRPHHSPKPLTCSLRSSTCPCARIRSPCNYQVPNLLGTIIGIWSDTWYMRYHIWLVPGIPDLVP